MHSANRGQLKCGLKRVDLGLREAATKVRAILKKLLPRRGKRNIALKNFFLVSDCVVIARNRDCATKKARFQKIFATPEKIFRRKRYKRVPYENKNRTPY
jgi:hypothetical protein